MMVTRLTHKYLFLALLLLGITIPLHSAYSQVAIEITENTSMRFGTIHALSTGDTITLTPTGTISALNGSPLTGSPAAANFQITGRKNRRVSISFSAGDTLTGPGGTLALGSFTNDAGNRPRFNRDGILNLNVGASLTIPPSLLGGSYSGTYAITVNYD